MVYKHLVTNFLNYSPFCLKPSQKLILYVNSKETLGNRFVWFKILDFSDFYNTTAYIYININSVLSKSSGELQCQLYFIGFTVYWTAFFRTRFLDIA